MYFDRRKKKIALMLFILLMSIFQSHTALILKKYSRKYTVCKIKDATSHPTFLYSVKLEVIQILHQ